MGLLAVNFIPECGCEIDLIGFLGDSPDAGGGCDCCCADSFLTIAPPNGPVVVAGGTCSDCSVWEAEDPTDEEVLSRREWPPAVDLSLFDRSLAVVVVVSAEVVRVRL